MLEAFLRTLAESLRSAGFDTSYDEDQWLLTINGEHFYAYRARRRREVSMLGVRFPALRRGSNDFNVTLAVQTLLLGYAARLKINKIRDEAHRMEASIEPYKKADSAGRASISVVDSEYVVRFKTKDLQLACMVLEFACEMRADNA